MRQICALRAHTRRQNVCVSPRGNAAGMNSRLRALYELAAESDGIFSIDQARECALTDDEIRHRVTFEWQTLYENVYAVAGCPITWRGQLRAGCLAGAPHAAASHRSAAALYDAPGGNLSLIEIATPRWLRTKRPGLIVHERKLILPEDTQLIDEIPVTRAELVAIQLASIYRSVDFIERVLHAMRRKKLITFESTQATLARHARRGVPGIRVTRAALERWDPTLKATESYMETTLLQILRDEEIRDLEPQVEIFDSEGRFVARVDLGIRKYKLGIEYDSDEFHSDEFSVARDNDRRLDAAGTGWTILTARKRDVRNGAPRLLKAIRAHIHASDVRPQGAHSTQESEKTA